MAIVLLSQTKYLETTHSATAVPPYRSEQFRRAGENAEGRHNSRVSEFRSRELPSSVDHKTLEALSVSI